jgi:hypothetical protein
VCGPQELGPDVGDLPSPSTLAQYGLKTMLFTITDHFALAQLSDVDEVSSTSKLSYVLCGFDLLDYF